MDTYRGLPFSKTGRIGKRKSEFAVVGLASDLGASTASGQSSGPAAIIARSERATAGTEATVAACGVVYPDVRDNWKYNERVSLVVETLAKNTKCVIGVGGDDSVSFGFIRGLWNEYPDLAVLHYDAHTDIAEGDWLDHCNWVSFVRRLNIPVWQWGQRVNGDVKRVQDDTGMNPLVIVIDLDVIDPAYAPGVAVPYPFGCTPNELWEQIKHDVTTRGKVVGIVVTELTTQRDVGGVTAHLGCVLLERLMNLVHTRS